MKTHRNKLILAAFGLQLFMLLSIITLVCAVSHNGQAAVIKMTGYDPYDALRGRYLRLSNPNSQVPLESGSAERYEAMRGGKKSVYVILEEDPDSGISFFSYASLDRPAPKIPYIKCMSRLYHAYDDDPILKIYPHIDHYYLNEQLAGRLDSSVRWNTDILLTLKVWHGMYVVDALEVDGQRY